MLFLLQGTQLGLSVLARFACSVAPRLPRALVHLSRSSCMFAGKARQPAAHDEGEGVVGTFDWIVDFTHLEKYLTCDSLGVQRDARSAFVPKP